MPVRIPRKRLEHWLQVLRELRDAAQRLAKQLGKVSVLLHGSYARGDFNLWSDVDLIIVSEAFNDIRPLDRYELVEKSLPDRAEPILWTPKEAEALLQKTAWRQALRRGVVVLQDDYSLTKLLQRIGAKIIEPEDLAKKIQELLSQTTLIS